MARFFLAATAFVAFTAAGATAARTRAATAVSVTATRSLVFAVFRIIIKQMVTIANNDFICSALKEGVVAFFKTLVCTL